MVNNNTRYAHLCTAGGSQWLNSDEPIVKIVAKMLKVIVSKPPITTHKTMLLQRFNQVSALLENFVLIELNVFTVDAAFPASGI